MRWLFEVSVKRWWTPESRRAKVSKRTVSFCLALVEVGMSWCQHWCKETETGWRCQRPERLARVEGLVTLKQRHVILKETRTFTGNQWSFVSTGMMCRDTIERMNALTKIMKETSGCEPVFGFALKDVFILPISPFLFHSFPVPSPKRGGGRGGGRGKGWSGRMCF